MPTRTSGLVSAVVGACVALGCAALLAQQRAVFRPGHEPAPVSFWHVKGEGWGRPAADAATVYFLSKDHRLLAFEAATGALRWQQSTGATGFTTSGSMVLVAGDYVVAGDYDVVAFDRSTGAWRWRFVPTDGYGPGNYLGDAGNGLVYAGSPAGRLYAIDALTGRKRWTAVVADDWRTVVFEPTTDREIVVAGYGISTVPNTGGVVALDASSGRERWRTPFPRPSNQALGSNSAGNPILVDDLVIAATGYGAIYAFDREDGSIRWSIPTLGGLPSDTLISPEFDFRPLARTGRTLLAGSLTGYLAAYSLDTRREIWRRAGPRHISIAFNISSDERSVYVPYLGGSLVALNVLTGSERWRTSATAGAFSFPVLPVGNRLYVASSSSGFYALKP